MKLLKKVTSGKGAESWVMALRVELSSQEAEWIQMCIEKERKAITSEIEKANLKTLEAEFEEFNSEWLKWRRD